MEIDIEQYSNAVLALKKSQNNFKYLENLKETLNTTFSTVYKSIAFDIDGTLTKENSSEIDSSMAQIIGSLLIKGVPVLLISGRGRGSMKEAVKQIFEKSKISKSYYKRLSGIAHNGVFWLKTKGPDSIEFLDLEETLTNKPNWSLTNIISRIQESKFKNYLKSDDIIITKEPEKDSYLLRINVKCTLMEDNNFSFPEFRRLLKKIAKNESDELFLTEATYAGNYLFNISNTNKVKALQKYADNLGIDLLSIIRIGDRGDNGGNDYDLLNSRCGFSVNKFSNKYNTCFPVLDNNYEQLEGIEATKELLNKIIIFPPLSLKPKYQLHQLDALQNFEKLAKNRTRIEGNMLLQRVKIRLYRFLDVKNDDFNINTFGLQDIFDKCGGIVFNDWEINNSSLIFEKLFGLQKEHFKEFEANHLKWCMFSDSKIIARGSYYYYGLTSLKKNKLENKGYLKKYQGITEDFFENSINILQHREFINPSLTNYKILLSIVDNVRNILLNYLHAIYIYENNNSQKNYAGSRSIFDETKKCLFYFYNFLFDENITWEEMTNQFCEFLKNFNLSKMINPRSLSRYELKYDKLLIRNWRETDFFLENVLAVKIAIGEFASQIPKINNAQGRTIGFIGLDYGGNELPIIAKILSEKRNLKTVSGLMKVSLYGNSDVRNKILKTDNFSYLEEFAGSLETLTILDGDQQDKITKFILLDDNCTTARTLEIARNLILTDGGSVLGAIIVRYPGTNRYKHMMFKNHGLPDPDILLSFIRGLVMPSPYSRLLNDNYDPKDSNKQYLDKLLVFDKAKKRIIGFLIKNGEKIYE
jgi:HAD superfamily hydrolase (TIGR01484 family)